MLTTLSPIPRLPPLSSDPRAGGPAARSSGCRFPLSSCPSLGRIETRAPAHQPSGDHRDEQDACFFAVAILTCFSQIGIQNGRVSLNCSPGRTMKFEGAGSSFLELLRDKAGLRALLN